MCFRVNLDSASIDKITKYLGTEMAQLVEKLRWGEQQAFAHPLLPVLTDSGGRLMRWGLVPTWAKDEAQAKDLRQKTLNARCETIFTLPSFRDAAPRRRCIILTSGFFEFRHEANGCKTRYLVHRRDGEALLLGGLWSSWQDQDGCSIVTMPANSLMSWVHNSKQRMPVVIAPDQLELWLDPHCQHPSDVAHLFNPDDTLPLIADPIAPQTAD